MLTRRLPLLIALTILLQQSPAFAWGERGHNLLTRVAVRLVLADAEPQFAAAFPFKELMLGHIANVPDIVWRSLPDVAKLNDPTHYMDLERVSPTLTLAAMPRTTSQLVEQMERYCAKPQAGFQCPPEAAHGKATADLAGTAPFRAAQLYRLMVEALQRAKASVPGTPAFKSAVDDALLAAGLMSHFVGDMGQPYHATVDYNGFASGHGGIHAYFETDLVNALDLAFDQEVLDEARQTHPFAALARSLPHAADQRDPLLVTYALALDSHAHIAAMNELDQKFAVLAPSRDEKGMHLPAKRRDAATVAPHFRAALRARLALSADTVAHLWRAAWEAAGRPDLRGFQSYTYPTAPAFIKPDY